MDICNTTCVLLCIYFLRISLFKLKDTNITKGYSVKDK